MAPRPVGVESEVDASAGRNIRVVGGVRDRHVLASLCKNAVPQFVDDLAARWERKVHRPAVYRRAAIHYRNLALEAYVPKGVLLVSDITSRARLPLSLLQFAHAACDRDDHKREQQQPEGAPRRSKYIIPKFRLEHVF